MSNDLTVIEQRNVIFYEDEITAVLVDEDGERMVYVPIRPVCDLLGIDWSGQRQRISRDAVLSGVVMSVGVTTTDIDPGSKRPRTSYMQALPLDFLNGWLFGINANRVKPEIRDRLIRYQTECYRVLAAAFKEGRLSPSDDFNELLKTDSPAVQAYRMIEAMRKIAIQQVLLEAQVSDHEQRLETIEAQLGDPKRHITPAQTAAVAEAVKQIAFELGRRSGRNEYGGVYAELHRRFQVPSYRELPAGQFGACMTWLREWYQMLIDPTAEF